MAVWAAMRPALWGRLSVRTTSPTCASRSIFLASPTDSSNWESSTCSTTVFTTKTLTSPLPGSSFTDMFWPAATLSRL